jgi:hypothetical protein
MVVVLLLRLWLLRPRGRCPSDSATYAHIASHLGQWACGHWRAAAPTVRELTVRSGAGGCAVTAVAATVTVTVTITVARRQRHRLLLVLLVLVVLLLVLVLLLSRRRLLRRAVRLVRLLLRGGGGGAVAPVRVANFHRSPATAHCSPATAHCSTATVHCSTATGRGRSRVGSEPVARSVELARPAAGAVQQRCADDEAEE